MTIATAPSVTLSVTIGVPYDRAFEYLSDGRHVAEWSTNFIFAVKEQQAGLIVTTPFGDVPFEVVADRDSGVVDHVIGGNRYRARLIPNGEGVDYVFTLQQPPGMPDAAWDKEGVPGLEEELQNLKAILESRR